MLGPFCGNGEGRYLDVLHKVNVRQIRGLYRENATTFFIYTVFLSIYIVRKYIGLNFSVKIILSILLDWTPPTGVTEIYHFMWELRVASGSG